MTKKSRNFIVLISIIFAFGIAFWVQQMRYQNMPDIPETIVIGTAADYPPFSFKQDGNIVGFDIDVAIEAVKRLGKKYVIEDVPFELLIPQAMMGKLPIIAAGLSRTPERAQQVYFSNPYSINNQLVVITKTNDVITGLDDLTEKQIAVNKGYAADEYMSKLNAIALDRVPTVADAIKALQSEKVYALVTEAQTVPSILAEYGPEKFNVFVIPESEESIALAISKHYPELAKKLSAILDEMQQDGTLDQLQKKWNLQ